MSTRQVGIKDVAAAAGVSIATVSQVLNNVAYARVGAETRDRVHQAARRLGYGPNRLAQALRTRRSDVIGVICEDMATAPNSGLVILGSVEAAKVRGYTIMIINAPGTGPDGSGDAGVATLMDRQVDGIL
jgi:LacI family transcriptional regulator